MGLLEADSGLPEAGMGLPKAGPGLPEAGLGLPKACSGLPEAGLGLPEVGLGLPNAGSGLSKLAQPSPRQAWAFRGWLGLIFTLLPRLELARTPMRLAGVFLRLAKASMWLLGPLLGRHSPPFGQIVPLEAGWGLEFPSRDYQ